MIGTPYQLSLQTRKDNMKTFPQFNHINEVPKYGITVGLNTISSLSKSAVIVLAGKEKKTASDTLNIHYPF